MFEFVDVSIRCGFPFVRGDDVAYVLTQFVYLIEFVQHELSVEVRPLAIQPSLNSSHLRFCVCQCF